MEKILTQDEIDQLFRAAQGAAKASPARKRQVQECDFRQAGQLNKHQVKQVTLLHDNFAPTLANSLGAYLRVGLQISLVSVEQIAYGDFLGRLPEPAYFCTVPLMPIEEFAAIQLDLPLAYPMIDLLLGGVGQKLLEVRDLTEIEEQILESVVSVICREIQNTWQVVLPLDFRVGTRLKHSQIMNFVSHGERTLNVSFEIQLSELRGALNFIFPAAVSNMLLRKLALQGTMQRRRFSADTAARLREHLIESGFAVDLSMTHLPVRIRDVADLQAGQVLVLRHAVRDPLFLAVNSRPVFHAVPVSCGPLRGALVQDRLPPRDVAERQPA